MTGHAARDRGYVPLCAACRASKQAAWSMGSSAQLDTSAFMVKFKSQSTTSLSLSIIKLLRRLLYCVHRVGSVQFGGSLCRNPDLGYLNRLGRSSGFERPPSEEYAAGTAAATTALFISLTSHVSLFQSEDFITIQAAASPSFFRRWAVVRGRGRVRRTRRTRTPPRSGVGSVH